MFKKVLITALTIILLTNSFTYAMTALDYATIAEQDSSNNNAGSNTISKEQKNAKNKQKMKDRFSGPAALETKGNYVVNPDNTEYFPETVAEEVLSEYIEAVDAKYGITFKNKRYYNTNQGKFHLINATFEPVANDYYTDYRFRLSVKKVDQRIKLPYMIYLKAYNVAGAFVDYSYTIMDDSGELKKDITLPLFKNNDRHVARIEFGLDTTGIDPAIVAKNNTSSLIFGYPDIFEVFADPNSDYTEERKAQIMETYNKEYTEIFKRAEQDVTRVNDIYEIQ